VKRVLHRILRGIAWLAGLTLAEGAAIYFFALLALSDMEQQPTVAVPGSLAGNRSVAADSNGAALVWSGTAPLTSSNGHAAPVVSASLVGNGSTLITTALDGSVRLTDVGASTWLTAITAPRVSTALHDRLWKPYGAPVAQGALWLAAQVLPLHIPESRKGERGRVFRDCPDCPEMVEIGPGSFFMGSPLAEFQRYQDEGPRQLVTMNRPFAVGRFAITFDEWDACVAASNCNGYKPEEQGWGRGRRPVINVSWADAKTYAEWLSKKTGQTYRLLSEAEWEYAARAGTVTPYVWGIEIGTGNANCDGCGSPWDNKQTAPVGSFKPNLFGLYDMDGNVLQWVQDCYSNTFNGAPMVGAARDAKDCASRVLRGGSWGSDPQFLRAASRNWYLPVNRNDDIGFRLARTLDP